MQATGKTYNFSDSLSRIDEILNSSDNNYEERKDIPSRSQLTFTNGFYVDCTAIFIDMCDSSSLPNKHTRPVVAKLYRCFISELVALLNGCDICREVNIHGDCVWGVFNTPYQTDINECIALAAKANSLINNLNIKLSKKGYSTIAIKIGIDYGRALMIKAGHKGSTINDVVWMGDVVNSACHLANEDRSNKSTLISNIIYKNLNDHNKSLFQQNYIIDCYEGNIVWSKYEPK